MRSHASPYNTVGEFFEKSSEVREYMRRAERPAPRRMTPRLVVRAVVRITADEGEQLMRGTWRIIYGYKC